MLAIDTQAPEVHVTLDNGDAFTLSDWRGRKRVVLYFFPKAFTKG